MLDSGSSAWEQEHTESIVLLATDALAPMTEEAASTDCEEVLAGLSFAEPLDFRRNIERGLDRLFVVRVE